FAEGESLFFLYHDDSEFGMLELSHDEASIRYQNRISFTLKEDSFSHTVYNDPESQISGVIKGRDYWLVEFGNFDFEGERRAIALFDLDGKEVASFRNISPLAFDGNSS